MKIKCFYCGKIEKHEFDTTKCCFKCAKLSVEERVLKMNDKNEKDILQCQKLSEKIMLNFK